MKRVCWILIGVLLLAGRTLAASSDAVTERQLAAGKELVDAILAQGPAAEEVYEGTLIVRHPDLRRSQVPLRYTLLPTKDGWRGIYQTGAGDLGGAARLVIEHRSGGPGIYYYTPPFAGLEAEPKKFIGNQGAIPFVSSDYWLTDLGLEFLRWPRQRLVTDAKITMRKTRPCKVVESTNPNPEQGGYARVMSWLDAETGAPIYAEAFDRNGRRLKVFSLQGFRKVNGRWQPEQLELRNEQTDSRTALELTPR